MALELGNRRPARDLAGPLAFAAGGLRDEHWAAPEWLLPHQVTSAQRVLAALRAFGGVILADEVGLGKTYVALAVASQFRSVTAAVPATLLPQWKRVASTCAVPLRLVSLEGLSRGKRIPRSDLVVVDEAHRLRNCDTCRYDVVARDAATSAVLLITATPLVNRARDLTSLLRLFLPDHGLAAFGVPSLEHVTNALVLGRAATSAIVAQTADGVSHCRLPRIDDEPVIRAPTLPPARLAQVLDQIDALCFPTSGATHLLRHHLLRRVASSGAAARETLRRHLAYLDRASTALRSGQQVPRGIVRQVLGPGDDLQLELLWTIPQTQDSPVHVTQRQIAGEVSRIRKLLRDLPPGLHDLKARRLDDLLRRRTQRKTVVFVSSVATGMDLANRFRWRSLAFVGAGRARIATGPIGVERVLELFAPRARRATVARHLELSVLIATDLVSEGLDLQDADGVVHYDLPWTPLRLAQRVGRIARLGADHSVARIFWFAPPHPIECRVRLSERLHRKAIEQEQVAVAVTSRLGRARVLGTQLAARAAVAREARAGLDTTPSFAVVQGGNAVAAAVEWRFDTVSVHDLVVLAGDPPTPVADYREIRVLLRELVGQPPSDSNPPSHLRDALRDVLRQRAWAAAVGPVNAASIALRRMILDRAIDAGRERDVDCVRLLDTVLTSVENGLRIGGERSLTTMLGTRESSGELVRWLPQQRIGPARVSYRVTAAVFGGSP